MRRVPALLLVVAVMSAVSASAALACSCPRYASARQQFDKADVIFLAKAEGRELFRRDGDIVTRFRVIRTLKGAPGARVRRVAHSDIAPGSCGVRFRRGQTYLVIAHRTDGGLMTSSCSAPQFPRAEFERLAGRRG